ncbi:unnamed protein product [Effrenium voratum]|uniref:Uncharacterized protein n=1 Tax=Effrenium voratum TaxID=2562239 RepID=A0AA36JBL0_9DINO|nr:unnamed protein product [Effrenium voratum]
MHDSPACDASEPHVFCKILHQLCQKGLFLGAICNLPSDTWSTAAEQMSPDPPRTSHALRRASQLWGLRELSSRQCSELALSNRVLQRSAVRSLACGGGVVLLEHPGRPSTASPWILPQIQQWLQMPDALRSQHFSLIALSPVLSLTSQSRFVFLVFWMCLSNPNKLNCIYRVNCDTQSSLACKSIPVLTQVSVGGTGGCFLGSQLKYWQNVTDALPNYVPKDPEHPHWLPDPSEDCLPPAGTLAKIPLESKMISTGLGYQADVRSLHLVACPWFFTTSDPAK